MNAAESRRASRAVAFACIVSTIGMVAAILVGVAWIGGAL